MSLLDNRSNLCTVSLRRRCSCDRCYQLKEKCVWPPNIATCSRCKRLNLVCQTLRPQRPAGRKPRYDSPSLRNRVGETSSTPTGDGIIVSTILRNNPELSQEEEALLLFFLGRPDNLEPYVICPSFTYAEQRSLTAPLPSALPILKDALLACAKVLQRTSNPASTDQDIGLRRAASAVESLRSLSRVNPENVAIYLALGRLITTFVYSAVGYGALEICRYTLGAVEPHMEMIQSDPNTSSWVNFLVLLEIVECIIHHQKPTIRLQGVQLQMIGRYLGLCLPLLPYYYDLCVISHSLHSTTDTSIGAVLLGQLDSISHKVQALQPSQPRDFLQRFESPEVIHMLAQVKVYRWAALLFSHRLRCKFGEEDRQAAIWSQEIIMELEVARSITNRPVYYVTLPYLIAAVEITGAASRAKALGDVDIYVDHFIPVVKNETKAFLVRVWQERDRSRFSRWFDSTIKPCVVLHSINASVFQN